MMQVRFSTHLQPLLDDFARRVEADPLPPLERETVLIAQNRGLRPWLELEWAKRFGCAASLDLAAPSGFATKLARRVLRVSPLRTDDGLSLDATPFDRNVLAWRLRPLLATLPEDELFAPLRTYLRDDLHRRDALAREIAACFDGYLVNRPDLMLAWERGENLVADLPHSVWQMALWQQLTAQARTVAPPNRLLFDLIRRLQRERPPRHLPPRVTVFGADIFPPIYLRVLTALARHVPVTLYTVAATRHFREKPRHPLQRQLGRRNRLFVRLLRDLGISDKAFSEIEAPVPPPDSVLHGLQQSLIHDAPPAESVPFAPDDASLLVHACHSPVRELEVLRDQLFHAFETLPGLRPDEVLVLMTDPETYGPIIEAVFGAEQVDGVRLPYHVAESKWSPERRALDAVRHVLRLLTSRFTGADVLAALDFPVVRQKAEILPEELPTLRAWVRDLRVCWGIDGTHKTAFDLPDDPVHTWREALRRLLLGYALGPVDVLVHDCRPHGAFGLEQADLLGRFARWLRPLCDAADATHTPRTLRAWAEVLNHWLDTFFLPKNDAEGNALRHVRNLLDPFQHLHHLAPDDTAVPFETVRSHLEDALDTYEEDESYVTGRITFAPVLPLRFAPFRVIALLGLNDTLFPRQDEEGAFDLTAATRQPELFDDPKWKKRQRIWACGDTNRRLFDQQLFLDTLLAARDRVILSYVGRSQKDNSERAPSVVIDSILDFGFWILDLKENGADDLPGPEGDDVLGGPSPRPFSFGQSLRSYPRRGEGGLVIKIQNRNSKIQNSPIHHRLQPFSPAYFEGEGGLFSYAGHHCIPEEERRRAATLPPFVPEPLPKEDESLALTLEELAEAWINPSRYFCARRLQLRLELPLAALPDREPLTLEGLDAYAVKDRLLTLSLEEVPDDEQYTRLRAEGLLPPGELGRAWFEQVKQPVQPLAEKVRPRLGRRAVQRVLHGPDWTIAARFDHLSDNEVLRFRCAKLKEKDWVRGWVAHLTANAMAEAGEAVPTTTVLFAEDETWHFAPLYDAKAHLQTLVDGLREIRRCPPPLFERASFAFAQKQTLNAAQKAFASSYNSTDGDDADAYVQLCFRGRDVWEDEFPAFATWAGRLWAPILDYRREGTP